jgi:hypothetical protein
MFNELEKSLNWMKTDNVSVEGASDVVVIVVTIANVFITIAFVVSFFAFVISFIQFITSTGDKKAAEKGQKNMLWSGLGMAGCLILYSVKNALITAFGINL